MLKLLLDKPRVAAILHFINEAKLHLFEQKEIGIEDQLVLAQTNVDLLELESLNSKFEIKAIRIRDKKNNIKFSIKISSTHAFLIIAYKECVIERINEAESYTPFVLEEQAQIIWKALLNY